MLSKIYPAVYLFENMQMSNIQEISEICCMDPLNFCDLLFLYSLNIETIRVIVSDRAGFRLDREGWIWPDKGDRFRPENWSDVYFPVEYGRKILKIHNFNRKSF